MLEIFLILSFASIFLFYYQEFKAGQSFIFTTYGVIYLMNYIDDVNLVDDTLFKWSTILCFSLTGLMLVIEKFKGGEPL